MEARCFQEPLDVPRTDLPCRKVLLGSTSFCLKTAQRVSPYSPLLRVSPYFLESEMNLTQNFLLRSDKLVIGQHLLLSPVNTVVKRAWSVLAHRPNPIQECFQQNHKSMSYSVCGRITV